MFEKKRIMKYILDEKEINSLVPHETYREEKKKVELLIKEYKKQGHCIREFHNAYCDDCPIASLNNQFNVKICSESYSK